MPICDKCSKPIADCVCESRSRSRERREREKEEKAADVQRQESPPAWALNMKNDILHGVRGAVQEELKPMKEDIARVKESVSSMEDRVGKAEADIKEIRDTHRADRVDEMLDKRMKDLEDKLSQTALKAVEDTSTVLFGGLQGLSFGDAEAWIQEQIKERKLDDPQVVYFKGDEFAGLAFAKFETPKAAENVVKKMSKIKRGNDEIWCKKDLPLDKRVSLSLLLGLRRQLIEWGYKKSKVRVKEDDNELVIGGLPVLKAVVQDYKLNMEWTSDYWKNWTELVDSKEFKKLCQRAEETLAKAKDDKGKGDGKGKKGY